MPYQHGSLTCKHGGLTSKICFRSAKMEVQSKDMAIRDLFDNDSDYLNSELHDYGKLGGWVENCFMNSASGLVGLVQAMNNYG